MKIKGIYNNECLACHDILIDHPTATVDFTSNGNPFKGCTLMLPSKCNISGMYARHKALLEWRVLVRNWETTDKTHIGAFLQANTPTTRRPDRCKGSFGTSSLEVPADSVKGVMWSECINLERKCGIKQNALSQKEHVHYTIKPHAAPS